MKSKDIKKLRMDLGGLLHDYYLKFGEKKYESFIKKLGSSMIKEYGEPFSTDNLRIMEAEYVTFNATLRDKNSNGKNSK